MTDILLLGSEGFLGKEVFLALEDMNFDFLGTTRRTVSGKRISVDLSNATSVVRLLGDVKPKIIINAAVSANFDTSSAAEMFPVNSLLPILLADFCKKNSSYLIHISGTIVHGSHHRIYSQSTQLTPNTEYGRTKLLADQAIQTSGCKSVIFRFGGIFGRKGPSHLRINRAIDRALKNEAPQVIGSGKAKRNYLFVVDAAKAICDSIFSRPAGVIYLGGETKTVEEMLNDICDILTLDQSPVLMAGEEAIDQLVKNDSRYKTTAFRNALRQLEG